MFKKECQAVARTIVGRKAKDLNLEELMFLWRLQLAGYVFVQTETVYEVKGN